MVLILDVADGVIVDANIQSSDSNFIDKNMTISQDKSFSYTLPNIMANVSYDLSLLCYKKIPESCLGGVGLLFSKASNGKVFIVVSDKNVSSFDEFAYCVTYDADDLELLNLCAMQYEKQLSIGTNDNISIISYEPGKILFKVVDKYIPADKVWSGIVNIFEVDGCDYEWLPNGFIFVSRCY